MNQPQGSSFASFREFYPFYLSEHSNVACRRLHFAGSSLVLGCWVVFATTLNPWWLLASLFCGYGFASFQHSGIRSLEFT